MLTDDEKRELIAAALMNSDSLNHERLCGCNAWPCVTYGTTRPWGHDAEFVAMEVLRLADALEESLTGSETEEWEYARRYLDEAGDPRIRKTEDVKTPDGYMSDGTPYRNYDAMRRRKAGLWEVVPDG